MSLSAITWAFSQHETTPTQRLVLLCLADYANHDNQAWPKPATIAERTGLSRASVYRATGELVKSGHLTRDDDRLTLRIGVSQGDGDSHSETDLSHSETPYIDEPKGNPQEPNGGGEVGGEITDIFKVGFHFSDTFKPRRRELDKGQRKIIYDALKVATADELCRCITAAHESDWHQKRGEHAHRTGKKHNTLTAILKPKRPGPGPGYTQRERIDFWLDRLEPEEPEGPRDYGTRNGIPLPSPEEQQRQLMAWQNGEGEEPAWNK